MPQDSAQNDTPAINPNPTTPPTSPSLEEFVTSLIQEKNFPQDLNQEVKDQIKKDLMTRLNDFLNAKLIASLPEKDIPEFEKILDEKPDLEKIQKFFSEKIPNFSSFLTQIFLEFRKTYLGIG